MKEKPIFLLISIVLSIAIACGSQSALAAYNWRFIVAGDGRGYSNVPSLSVNTAILSEVVDAIVNESDIDFVLFSGDLVYGHPTSPENFEDQLIVWRDTMQPVYDAGIKVYPIRGNHDTHESYNKGVWDTIFSGPYALPDNGPAGEENVTYSFQHNNALIIGLDLYSSGYHHLNQTWLDTQFASNIQPHVFLYAHAPMFKVSHTDSTGNLYPSERNVFWESITAAGGRTYFACHDHFYNHARIDDGDGDPNNDLHQFIAGSSGATLALWDGLYNGNNGSWTPQLVYHEKEYGYMLVEIDDLHVTMTWKHRTGPNTYQATSEVFSYSIPTDSRTLTISSTLGGVVTTPGEGQLQYGIGTVVPIEAVADANYHFFGWTGTAVNAGKIANQKKPNTAVTMDGDYTLEAIFTIIGEFIGDSKVDLRDFALLASYWYQNDPLIDIAPLPDGDDIIDELDLDLFCMHWLDRDLLWGYHFNLPEFTLDTDPNWLAEGEWAFGQPTGNGGAYGYPDPNSGYEGSNVYGVNLNGDYNTSVGGPYYLKTGPIDCSDYSNVRLNFARWLNADFDPYVKNKIEVSRNGSSWNLVWEHTDLSAITDDGWQILEYDISSFADDQSTIYIRWSYQILDDHAYQYSGWNIDEIKILGELKHLK